MKLTDRLTRDEERQVVAGLVGAIEARPGDWEFGEFRAVDQKSCIAIWTASGFEFIAIDGPQECRTKLRLANKWRIWRALKRLHKSRPHISTTFLAIMAALNGVTP